MNKSQLLKKIESFQYWHYPFDLGSGLVIKPTENYNAKTKPQLRKFIWPAVLDLCGGSLEGLRVLDVGCNAGFWSVEAHRSGAAYVLGIDPRAGHLEQAEFVRDALGISPKQLEYRQMSVYDLSPKQVGEFDLCLLLRVLQHLDRPLLALKRVRKVCQAYLVVDVKMIRMDGPALYFVDEDPEGLLEGTSNVALRPSRQAVELMLKRSGFTDVKKKRPKQPLESGYFTGKRAVFTARVKETRVFSVNTGARTTLHNSAYTLWLVSYPGTGVDIWLLTILLRNTSPIPASYLKARCTGGDLPLMYLHGRTGVHRK